MRYAPLPALLAVVLAGCATRQADFRQLPDEHPAADNMAAARSAAAVSVAIATEAEIAGGAELASAAPPVMPADAPSMYTYDPWERVNRRTYRFNAHLDEAVVLPVATAYRRLPAPLRLGVHNVFGNLAALSSVFNYALQGRPISGLRSLGRFAVNGTLGIGGLFDVATRLGLTVRATGFSATLSRWGMHPGAYLVIPLLGPSTLRDGVGMATDRVALWGLNPLGLYRGDGSWYISGARGIDGRASTGFRYYSTGSPFEYDTVRFLYVHRRLVEDAATEGR